ncbi:MAG: hypothetical protein R3A78_10265 [Polyangiales bacterium]
MNDTARWALLGAIVLFVLYLVLKSMFRLRPMVPRSPEARRRLAEAKARAVAESADPTARAAAWKEAARIAFVDLKRANLAASFAARALSASMDDAEAVELLTKGYRRVRRYRTLEKWLWRCLAHGAGGAYETAHRELIALYDGPMRRPDWARALRAMRPGA